MFGADRHDREPERRQRLSSVTGVENRPRALHDEVQQRLRWTGQSKAPARAQLAQRERLDLDGQVR